MDLYLYDLDEIEEFDYRTPGASGNYALEMIKKFGGMDDFTYDSNAQRYECLSSDYAYWARILSSFEELNSKITTYRKKYGDDVLNIIATRSSEYSNPDEVLDCNNDWLDRLPWISTQLVNYKGGEKKKIAYEDERVVPHLEDGKWIDENIGVGDTDELAIVDYIRKCPDN